MHGAPKAQSLPRSARAPVPDLPNTPAFPTMGTDLDKEQIDPDVAEAAAADWTHEFSSF